MKAESIEQIRQHLAKGGRVQRLGLTVDVIELDGAVMSFSDPLNRFCQVALHDEEVPRWELLPFEELPHDQGHICNELPDEDAMDPYTQRKQQLRQKVLHGYTWTTEEQREVWHMLTGEVVEPGKRCNYCECTGKLPGEIVCAACVGDGYRVRPTWMEGGR